MVIRKGRLPREPRVRQYPSTDKTASQVLRLRRDQKLTDVNVRAPAIDYAKIQEKSQQIIADGRAIEQEGIRTDEDIIANEQALRERIFPPEPEEPQPERPSIFERLPARIPEPPKIEEEVPKFATRVATGVALAGTRLGSVAKTVQSYAKKSGLEKKIRQSDYAKAVGLHEV